MADLGALYNKANSPKHAPFSSVRTFLVPTKTSNYPFSSRKKNAAASPAFIIESP